MKKVFFIFLCIFNFNTAYACFSPPSEFVVSPEELVKRSKNIYLAEAIKKDSELNYEFVVVENLRETKDNSFISRFLIFVGVKDKKSKVGINNFHIKGSSITYKDDNFNNHTEDRFWGSTSGRTDIGPDCELKITFEIGKKYLIFTDQPYHFKSFEEIKSDDDKWLARVRSLVQLQ